MLLITHLKPLNFKQAKNGMVNSGQKKKMQIKGTRYWEGGTHTKFIILFHRWVAYQESHWVSQSAGICRGTSMLTQNLPESPWAYTVSLIEWHSLKNHVPPPLLPRHFASPFQYRTVEGLACETKKNGSSAKRSLGYITHVQPLRGVVWQSKRPYKSSA